MKANIKCSMYWSGNKYSSEQIGQDICCIYGSLMDVWCSLVHVFFLVHSEGMVEILVRTMKTHISDVTVQRRAAFVLTQLYNVDRQNTRFNPDDEGKTVKQRIIEEGYFEVLVLNMERNSSHFTQDLIDQARPSHFLALHLGTG